MKRFWAEAQIAEQDGGWTIELDGKPLRTPARTELLLPTVTLAKAIAEEWNAAGETVDPRTMPLTGLANAAIDRVRPDPEAFARDLAGYAQGDLTCYRADSPRKLVERQEQGWDPLLTWARRRYDIDFRTTTGVIHVDQPAATVERLAHAVATLDPFRLAALSPLVTIGGSLVTALAVLEHAVAPEAAWDALTIDDQWQLEQWGGDAVAEERLENRRNDFLSAARFIRLLEN